MYIPNFCYDIIDQLHWEYKDIIVNCSYDSEVATRYYDSVYSVIMQYRLITVYLSIISVMKD